MADTKKKDNFWKLIIWAIIALLVVPISGLGYNIYLIPNAGQETYASCKQKAEDLFQEVPQKEAKQKDFENNILCADLAAQQAMSDRAHWGLFIGIWGLIVLGITLWQTRKAARAASDTLKVAKDTLEVAKDTAYSELRAYAGVGACNYTFSRNDNGSAWLDVYVEVNNYGQTPAYNVQSSTYIKLVDCSDPDKLEPAPFNDNGYTLNRGNKPSISLGLNLDSNKVRNLVDGKARLFIVTALEFSDYKGEQHWERIHFVLPAPGKEDDFLKSHGVTKRPATYYRTESSDQPIISAT